MPATILYFSRDFNPFRGLATDTPRRLWEGIETAATTTGVNLITLISESSADPEAASCLVSPEAADGFLFWASGNPLNAEQARRRLGAKPLVGMSIPIEGHPCVTVGNESGMEALVRHLIEVHGRRKLALVMAGAGHIYTQERLTGYRRALEAHGIEVDPRWITPAGTWEKGTGTRAVAELLDQRRLVPGRDLDGLVCMNDRIALGVIEALEERGLRVPDDLVVTGFNNHPEALANIPSITSVAMPFSRQAELAFHLVHQWIQGCPPAMADVRLEAEVAIHESCGCHPLDWDHLPNQSPLTPGERRIPALIALLEAAGFAGHQIVTLLEKTLRQALSSGDGTVFWDCLRSFQKASKAYHPDDVMLWQRVLGQLRVSVLEKGLDSTQLEVLERVIGHARWVAVDGDSRAMARQRIGRVVEEEAAFEFNRSLASAQSRQEIFSALDLFLPRIRVQTLYLSLYPHPIPDSSVEPPPETVWAYAFDGARGGRLEVGSLSYRPTVLLPPGHGTAEPFSLVVRSLLHGGFSYGLLVYDEAPEAEPHRANLAGKIAAGLKTVELLTHLRDKTEALQASLDSLNVAQSALIEAEKLSAVGRLVAGVSHEVNTPLGVGVTASTHIVELCRRLVDLIEGPRPVRSEFVAGLKELGELGDVVYQNLERAAALIQSFKQVAVDQRIEEARQFVVSEYFGSIFKSLAPLLKKGCHRLDLSGLSDHQIHSYPGVFSQIFSNLLTNSLLHGFGDRQNGLVRVASSMDGGHLVITYSDDGVGMDEETLSRIYEPFFTTKRGHGGTGLGMSVVYNLVRGKLGGQLVCYSRPGEGTRFTLTLPLTSSPADLERLDPTKPGA